MNIEDWFALGWTGSISLTSKGLSRVFSNTIIPKHQFFSIQLSLESNSHPYITTGKTITFTRQTFAGKVMSLLFNMLARLVIVYLPKGKYLLIHGCSDFGAQENSLSLFPLFLHLFVMKWWDWMPWSSFFECWVLSQLFHSPLSLSSRSSLVSSSLLSAIMAVSSAYLKLFIFFLSILIPACASSSPALILS